MPSLAVHREKTSNFSDVHKETERLVADAMGRLMEFWGFKRHMGRIWTVLYLAPRPLNTADIAETVQLSSSAVSLSLGELQRWGAVRKTWRAGDRRDFYEAETRVWRLLTRVYERRELVLIKEVADTLREAQSRIAEVAVQAEPGERKHIEHIQRRLTQLVSLTKIGERLVRTLIAGRILDPRPLREVDQ